MYPVPLLQIDTRPPPYLSSLLLLFTASAFPSRCAPGLPAPLINFTWTVTQQDSSEPFLNSSSPVFRILPGVLQAGQVYTATLAASWRFEIKDPQISNALQTLDGNAVASHRLAIDYPALEVRIEGGNRLVSRHSTSVQIDASQSLDPDWCAPQEGLLRQRPCHDPEVSLRMPLS